MTHLQSCAAKFTAIGDKQTAYSGVKTLLESDGLTKLETAFEDILRPALSLP
jgi:hypothetical protein